MTDLGHRAFRDRRPSVVHTGDRSGDGSGRSFAALLDRACAGDRDAISAIWRSEQPRLVRVLRGLVGDAADDVASQTWLEVMGVLGRFSGDERGFRALLFTIARRRVADHRRTQRRKPALPMSPADLTATPHRGADGRDVAVEVGDGIEGEEAVARIRSILPPHQAEIVLLRVVGGLAVDEVARIVGRTPGAVRVQQHRALRRLTERLGGSSGWRPLADGGPADTSDTPDEPDALVVEVRR